MVEYTEEDKQKVLEKLGQKTWKIKDLAKILKMDKKVVQKIILDLIEEGKAAYWSSGSTTYYSTPEYIEEYEKKRAGG
ncbi:MAG: sulfite reductase [Archaeoglobales archaeon]|nr:MAG: sulfite reductase [Archaeoglobales archaeon]